MSQLKIFAAALLFAVGAWVAPACAQDESALATSGDVRAPRARLSLKSPASASAPQVRASTKIPFSVSGQVIGVSVRKDLAPIERQASVSLSDEPQISSETGGLVVSGDGPIVGKSPVRAVFSYSPDGLLQGVELYGPTGVIEGAFKRIVKDATKDNWEDGLFQQGGSLARMGAVKGAAKGESANESRIEVMSASLYSARQLVAAQKSAKPAEFRYETVLGLFLILVVAVVLLRAKRRSSMKRGPRTAKPSEHIATTGLGTNIVKGAAIGMAAGFVAGKSSQMFDDSGFSDQMSPSLNVDGTPMMGSLDIHGNPYGVTQSDEIIGGNGFMDSIGGIGYTNDGFMDFGGGHDPFE